MSNSNKKMKWNKPELTILGKPLTSGNCATGSVPVSDGNATCTQGLGATSNCTTGSLAGGSGCTNGTTAIPAAP